MISVIIPVYKVAPYLRQCVDSILYQTIDDLEVLLIDDGSPDQCSDICDEYKKQDSRVRVFHTRNKGLSAARNLGLQEAKGEYIGFVDSDDWIESDMYEVLLRRMQETDADICVCCYDAFNEKRIIEWKLPEMVYDDNSALIALLNGSINSIVWNKIYKRELFWNLSFPEGKNYEDIVIMHRLFAQAHRVVVITDLKYHNRLRSDSISKTYTAKNLIDYSDAYLTRYYYYCDEKPEISSVQPEAVLLFAAKGISKVWRWWHGCSIEEKKIYAEKIDLLLEFSREYFPIFGYKSWPKYLRFSTPFMHSSSGVSFALLYGLNQLYRKLYPGKANVV